MPESTPSTRYAWYVVGILALANISGQVDRFILNLLVGPIKRDLGISDTKMSYLIGLAFAIFYTLLGLPIARLADRSNRRNIMAAGVGLWSLFTAACATAQTYGRLMLMRIGVGVGEATLVAPSVSLIADYFPRETRGRALSAYWTAVFLGAGLAYFIGGSIVGLVGEQGRWHVPVVGDIHPWQSVFLVVGLPGLLIALLFFTIREPQRTDARSEALPLAAVLRYVAANRRTLITLSLGFGSSSLVNFGIAAWLPEFFIRTFDWTPSEAGRVQGLLTATIGVAGAFAGGWLADWFLKRGRADGPLLVGMIGAVGMLVSATMYPLMPSSALAVAWLAVVNVFAAFPWGAALAGAADIFPAAMRAQGTSVYLVVVSLVSFTLGPSSVAWFTDYVFHNDLALRYSLAIVNVIGMTLALGLFAIGLGAYRRTVAYRETWGRTVGQSDTRTAGRAL